MIVGIVGDAAHAIARDLIDRFGSIARLLHSVERSHLSVPSLPEALAQYLQALSCVFAHAWRVAIADRPILSSSEDLRRYLHHKMAFSRVEQFRVLFLDAENKLLADDLMWEGTVNGVQVHNREVIVRALHHGATAMILAHNHPSGSVMPSDEDIQMTRRLVAASEPFDLVVQDHLIVAEGACFSMRLQQTMFS